MSEQTKTGSEPAQTKNFCVLVTIFPPAASYRQKAGEAMEIQERDRTWFCEEIQRCRTSLYRLALSITANPEDAAEAAAEAVCRAYEKFPQLRDRKKFQPWILKITRNEAYALCRHRSRMVPLEHLMEDAAVPGPNLDDTLWRAVERLPQEQREAVVLFYYEDLPTEAISRVTGVSPGAVRTRLSRAREKLRRMLEVNHGE